MKAWQHQHSLGRCRKSSNCIAGTDEELLNCILTKQNLLTIKRQLLGAGEIGQSLRGLLERPNLY